RGYTDRAATEQLMAELERKAARREQGLVDPFEHHRKRTLSDHLADFRSALAAKGNSAAYVSLVDGRLRALAAGCGWRLLDDLSATQAEVWLASQRNGTIAITLPIDLDAMTPSEAASLLGVSVTAVRKAVRQYGLAAFGHGRARTLPRATVQSLLDR